MRRGKVLAAADQFAQLVGGAIETLVGQSVGSKGLMKQGSESVSEPAVRHIPLPPSIIANAEPFRHGDWRKEPYPIRQATLFCTCLNLEHVNTCVAAAWLVALIALAACFSAKASKCNHCSVN